MWLDFGSLCSQLYAHYLIVRCTKISCIKSSGCKSRHCISSLQVHFRGYPANILTPCENEDSVKWSYINSLKEVAM